MNVLYFVGTAIGGVAIGFFVGWKLRGRKAKKEIEKIQQFDAKQINSIYKKLRELRSTVNANLQEKEKVWSDIASEINDDTIEEPVEKAISVESELSYRKPPRERANYHAVANALGYETETEINLDNGTGGIVRDYADNGIYEIPEQEYLKYHEFKEEEIEYYDASGDVFKDGTLMDVDEIPLHVGYDKEGLSKRFLYNEPKTIYVRNPEYERIYIINWCQGLMPE